MLFIDSDYKARRNLGKSLAPSVSQHIWLLMSYVYFSFIIHFFVIFSLAYWQGECDFRVFYHIGRSLLWKGGVIFFESMTGQRWDYSSWQNPLC